MGRPKKYVYEPGDIVGKGWVYLREGASGPAERKVWAICPVCKKEVERPLGNLIRTDRPQQSLMSCGCDIQRWRAERFRVGTPLESCLRKYTRRYVSNAQKRGYVYALLDEQAHTLFQQNCHYCGQPPSLAPYKQTVSAAHIVLNGIDRIDNSLGYITGNVVTCCATCNLMKNILSQEVFFSQCRRIASRFPESP